MDTYNHLASVKETPVVGLGSACPVLKFMITGSVLPSLNTTPLLTPGRLKVSLRVLPPLTNFRICSLLSEKFTWHIFL